MGAGGAALGQSGELVEDQFVAVAAVVLAVAHRVNHHSEVGSGPKVDQAGGLAVAHCQVHRGR